MMICSKFLVEREQHPFGARALKSFLPLHRCSSHASLGLTSCKIAMDEGDGHGAFARCRS